MLIAQSIIKPLHSYIPHTCWVRQVLTLAINNVAQKEEATLKSCEDVAGSRRTQPPVDCLWSLVPSFLGLSVNSDNLPFSYVILFLLFTYVNYMHENWSWHAYRFALGFLWKNRCDTRHLAQPSSPRWCPSSFSALRQWMTNWLMCGSRSGGYK
jgi:hypothetical protein